MNHADVKPLISVIIPTFNRGWTLRESIDSVLAQEFKDYELIVVDDGSTDNTQQILESYGKRMVMLRQSNKGVSAARNTGINKARGKYIAFLDSDDEWLPQKLSSQKAFFGSNSDALICQTEEIWIRNGKRVNPKKRHKKRSGFIFEPSLSLCLVSPSAVMIKKCLFDEIGMFDEDLPACEDYDLWLRISYKYPVYLIDEPLIIKRGGHSDQLSKEPGLDKYRIKALEKIIVSGHLSRQQHIAALNVMKEKCAIFANGCEKRGRNDEMTYYKRLADRY